MAKILRRYQQRLKAGVYEGWQRVGQRQKTATVIGCTATGSGKTVTMANMANELQSWGMKIPGLPQLPNHGHGVIIAHRSELVGQISTAMGGEGLRHNVLGSTATIRSVVHKHMDELNGSFYDPRANWTVASVDTLLKRGFPAPERVGFAFTDEGHHCLAENKWGRAMQLFPLAFGLLMTATPCRTDGQGLGRHHDGIADLIVNGPGLGELVGDGYLVNYRVLKTRARDLDTSDVHTTASGEVNQKEAARAVKRSREIIGDAVRIYKENTPGKLAIFFASDLEHAAEVVRQYVAAGIPCEMVSGKDDEGVRSATLRRFKARQTLVLVNVDLFGEGFDVPACEVVIMCRITKSFSLFAQMIGRMLRLDISPILMAAWDTFTVEQRLRYIAESAKPLATLIDMVGNVGSAFKVGGIDYVGLPEGFTNWTLDRTRNSHGPSDAEPIRKCLHCGQDFSRADAQCPYCGTAVPPPAVRSNVLAVDGDVFELDDELLALLRGQVLAAMQGAAAKVSDSWIANDPRTASMAASAAETKKFAVQTLAAHIDAWADATGFDHAKCSRTFYFKFGMDVLTALSQTATKCAELAVKVSNATYELRMKNAA